jgi:hypothetical protein
MPPRSTNAPKLTTDDRALADLADLEVGEEAVAGLLRVSSR